MPEPVQAPDTGTYYTPEPGEFFVVRTEGWAGRLIRVGTDSDVNHAGIYLGKGLTLEAQPGGAIYGHITQGQMDAALWSGMNPTWRLSRIEGEAVCTQAKTHHGDPYSWLDIACISLTILTRSHIPSVVSARLDNPHRNICSQLVDRVYEEAGVHLFTDGRPHGAVSPGDLRDLITGRV